VTGRTLGYLADLPVSRLDHLPPGKAKALEALEVTTVFDLLTLYPRRHIDRTRQVDVADLAVGDEAVVLAEVRRSNLVRGRNRRGTRVELVVADQTGTLKVVFFNQHWRAKQLVAGTQALFSAKLTEYRGGRQMVNPVVDVVLGTEDEERAARRTLRVIPVYPASAKAGLDSWEIGTWVAEALRRAGDFADPLPEQWRTDLSLVGRTEALHGIHLPAAMADIGPARRRLAFDELFRLQLSLVLRRRSLERDAQGIRHAVSPEEADPPAAGDGRLLATGGPGPAAGLVRGFLAGLPFDLTGAQRQAVRQILADMAGPLPMHRLLQGDVGSGKTVVALACLLGSVQGGHQGALMVPTEVLAEQHFASVRSLVGQLEVPDPDRLGGRRPVTVALLTNRTSAAERVRLHEGLRAGQVDVLVGTHALLTDEVRFHSLGAVVIDEQHRFGVEQRSALREKGGADPDVLVMTATPIPRTAAMVVFGDLDMTVLDELPPGRTPIVTQWARTELDETEAWARVREEVAAGHRAYVVCPLVEGSERVEARAATQQYGELAAGTLSGLRLGLLHGQMPAAAKEKAIEDFRSGAVDVLVATTVVEVGVDVPEATVMVVLDADRFGIAQLHQLRGRVGRGALKSWCYLLGTGASPDAEARLLALERSTDGFVLAEEDLRLRGEGTILGARQKGRSDLKLASLHRDRDLLDAARDVALSITASDPVLESHGLLGDELKLFMTEEEAEYLFKS
jgi:ATP-dependent DNA helicase RecG